MTAATDNPNYTIVNPKIAFVITQNGSGSAVEVETVEGNGVSDVDEDNKKQNEEELLELAQKEREESGNDDIIMMRLSVKAEKTDLSNAEQMAIQEAVKNELGEGVSFSIDYVNISVIKERTTTDETGTKTQSENVSDLSQVLEIAIK